jgi:hypothetical protein
MVLLLAMQGNDTVIFPLPLLLALPANKGALLPSTLSRATT